MQITRQYRLIFFFFFFKQSQFRDLVLKISKPPFFWITKKKGLEILFPFGMLVSCCT